MCSDNETKNVFSVCYIYDFHWEPSGDDPANPQTKKGSNKCYIWVSFPVLGSIIVVSTSGTREMPKS
eukprot:6028223-Amphidinium_carterae.1